MPARPLALLASLLVPLAGLPAAALARSPGSGVPATVAKDAPAALVRRCVAAYGGKAALAKLAVQRQRGAVTSRLQGGAAGRLVRVYARSGRLRVEIAYPGRPEEVRVLDGSRGWRFGEEVSGPLLEAMVLQAARLDLPAVLAAWQGKLDDLGTMELDGKRLRVLAVQVAPGLVVEAAIDPATGRILRSRGTSRGQMPLEFTTTYSDFRQVKGVLVAFREANFANGQTTGETVLESVEFPAALPDATFRP